MMRVSFRFLALSTALIALVAGGSRTVSAQQEAQTELQSWRVPGWSFTPGVAIGWQYDSNVAIAGPDVAGKTAGDTLMEIEPMGQLEFFSPRTAFSSGYRGSVRRYFELNELDGLDHRLYATLRHRLTRRVTIFFNEHFQEEPTTDALELSGVPFRRVGSRYNLFSGGVEARLSRSLDFNTGYEMMIVDFLSEGISLSDGIVHGAHAELTHRFDDRLSMGGEYGLRRADLNTGAREFSYQNAGGVLHYRTAERTTLDLSGGITYMVERGTGVTRTGPYVRAGLTHMTARATFAAEYMRNYTPSFTLSGAQRSNELRGYINMPFSRNRFYVQQSAAFRRSDPFGLLEPALNSIRVQSTLGYALQRWLRLEGHYSYSTQDNRLAGGRVTRHVTGIQLVISEPMRIQ